jgi:GNAT superfamily N-acetyltransferase
MSRKAFTDSCVSLPSCTLQLDFSEAEALALGNRLAAMDPWLTLGVGPTALAGYLVRDDPALFRYGVRVEGQVAGVVCVRHPWLRGPYIELLGITADYQNLRLGSEIMAFVEQEARLLSHNLWVVTSEFNVKARRFYQRHGFQEISHLPGLVKPGYVEILLRKSWS